MGKHVIKTKNAPQPKGPYSQAIAFENLLFISGQGPIIPESDEFILDSIESETQQTLSNIKIILEEAGSSMEKVLKITVYLANLEDFERMNAIYGKFFPGNPPARSCVQSGLLFDTNIEIDAVAFIP